MKTENTKLRRPIERGITGILLFVMSLAVSTGYAAECTGLNWNKQAEWVKTEDLGQVSQEMIDLYNAEPTNFHPVGLMGDPFVLYDNAKYRMWYSATAIGALGNEVQGIAYAESTDGVTWSDPKDATTLVKLQITPQDVPWHVEALETPSVVKVGNTYFLYFSGRYQDQAFKIGLATSQDGYSWNVHDQPVLEATLPWEYLQVLGDNLLHGGVLEPSVLYSQESGSFSLWYSTYGVKGLLFGGSIGYATSTDGIQWTKNTTPVFEPSPNEAWDNALVGHVSVEKEPNGGPYHMFYAGFSKGSADPDGIGHAVSPNGIDWTRSSSNPVITTDSPWHSTVVGGPTSVIREGTIHLWYMGINTPDFSFVHFGKATSKCDGAPRPDVTINGVDGPVTLAAGEPVNVRIALTAGNSTGMASDWWVIANTPAGFYFYRIPQGWTRLYGVTYTGPLMDLPATTLLNSNRLPAGEYTFFFAVDNNQDGNLDATYRDLATLVIQ